MSKDPKAPNLNEFRPSEFMRARRPELFSDSQIGSEPEIGRAVFEYHLETLTNRKQEIEFEHFCRKLAEKLICPNLRPQTGPTGGGDSKVDAETYPVSEEIALRWYEGVGREAAQERWAFAFSAKKDWEPKVRSDIKSIAGTNRGYTRAYFFTNQFAPDKRRAAEEDSLTKAYGIAVTILDRNWILQAVFEKSCLQLAIEALNLTIAYQREDRIVGPSDAERERQLVELDAHIADPDRYRGVDYQLAEDCLQSALLARAIEKPVHEVIGRFARAEAIAEKVGDRQQRLRITYRRAWTCFWWYDDFGQLNRLYDEVESLACGSVQIDDIDLLFNLWQLLRPTVARGKVDPVAAKIEERTSKLRAELDRLAALTDRPTTALEARGNRYLLDLNDGYLRQDMTAIDASLQGLKHVLEQVGPLVNFRVARLAESIKLIGQAFVDNPVYDELFETLLAALDKRTSAGSVGQSLLERGIQKLDGGMKYDAIRLFGRAQQKLAMREYRAEHITALAGCAMAYEQAGLLWAARANMLVATSQALSPFWEEGKVVPQAIHCLQKLAWLELQLGRVPQTLLFIETASVIAAALHLKDERPAKLEKERETQDLVLGILLLKADLGQIGAIDFLPPVLLRLGLLHSYMALLYGLGHEDFLRSDGWIPSEETEASTKEFFWLWRNQPASDDLPHRPEFLAQNEIVLKTNVLGCNISLHITNNLASLKIAEAVLAALEAFLSTSLDEKVLPHRSTFQIRIRFSALEETSRPRVQSLRVAGEPFVEVEHTSSIQDSDPDSASRDWLWETCVLVVTGIAVVDDPLKYFTKLAEEEGVFGRIVDHRSLANCLRNIAGDSPKVFLSSWKPENADRAFPVRRTVAWDTGLEETPRGTGIRPTPGKGETPAALSDLSKLKHRDQHVLSLIDIPLWDRAQWGATYYLFPPKENLSPVMALAFQDEEAGREIFQNWIKLLGSTDGEERLRVTIVRGTDKNHPSRYKVLISTNLPKAGHSLENTRFIIVGRKNLMAPETTRNLDSFLDKLARFGRYLLVPAGIDRVQGRPNIFFEDAVLKCELNVRQAWQLAENDADLYAIDEDDDPLIPEGVTEAPITQALKRRSRGNAS